MVKINGVWCDYMSWFDNDESALDLFEEREENPEWEISTS
jgi:hypothetical protein